MNVNQLLATLFFLYTLLPVAHAQHAADAIQKPAEKLYSFGVLADIQYADVEKAGNRDYRNSIYKLEKCVAEFNTHSLSFVVHIGDIIDRDYESYDKPLAILDKAKAPVYNVLGNHEFSVDDSYKKQVKKRLNNKKGYFSFEKGNLVFIILDGTDVSTFAHKEGTKKYEMAQAKYDELKAKGANNAYTWNGGIGDKQFSWLEKQLQHADQQNKKVVIFCHWPLLPENGTQLWNNREVLHLIESHPSVVAWMSGHHHAGGYEKVNNIHHLTLKGMVEAQSETSCGIVEVYADKLFLRGYGDQQDQLLDFPK